QHPARTTAAGLLRGFGGCRPAVGRLGRGGVILVGSVGSAAADVDIAAVGGPGLAGGVRIIKGGIIVFPFVVFVVHCNASFPREGTPERCSVLTGFIVPGNCENRFSPG